MTDKIKIDPNSELTDINRQISKADGKRVLLVFEDTSDILVTPANLKTIQSIADDYDKSIAIQMPNDSTGHINAEDLNITTIRPQEELSDDEWQEIEDNMIDRKNKYTAKLKKSGIDYPTSQAAAESLDNQRASEPSAESDQTESQQDVNETTAQDEVQADTDESIPEQESVEIVDNTKVEEETNSDSIPEVSEEKPQSEFSRSIEAALKKSEQMPKNNNKVVSESGVSVALDHEIEKKQEQTEPIIEDTNQVESEEESAKPDKQPESIEEDQIKYEDKPVKPVNNTQPPKTYAEPSLTGRDFKIKESNNETQESRRIKANATSTGASGVAMLATFKDKITSLFSNIKSTSSNSKDMATGFNYKRILSYLAIPTLLIGGLALWYIYNFTPFVRVDFYIDTKELTVEKEFKGTPEIDEFNATAQEIPVKEETVTRTVSGSASATGTGSEGETSGGIASIKCFLDETVNIPAGTVLTSDATGLNFVTQNDVTITCPDIVDVTVEAADVGAEYNLDSGNQFSVQGYSVDSISATNQTSFSGGLKEEFTIVSEGDIAELQSQLEEQAYEQAQGDLRDEAGSNWNLIDSTITEELSDAPEVDLPAGTRTEEFTMSVTVESTALFYSANELESNVQTIVLEAAEEENLFQSNQDIELELSEEINSKVEFVGVEGQEVTLKLTATGTVKPLVSEEDLIKRVEGKSLEEGKIILQSLPVAAKPPEITFEPDYFPDRYRYFPERQGRLILDIEENVEEVEAEENPDESESESEE